ncbi:MAG: CvpA family protein [Pseudomonadota bacterium]
MSDLFSGPLTAFDVIVLAVIIVSAVMSLGRGLMREASSVLAFIAGGAAAYIAVALFRDPARAMVPSGWPEIAGDAVLVVLGFLLAYSLAAYIGAQLSKLIHSAPEIGVLDRVAGALFGAARGGLMVVLFVMLMKQVIPDQAEPNFIRQARLYPAAESAANWVIATVPGMAVDFKNKVDENLEQGQTSSNPDDLT